MKIAIYDDEEEMREEWADDIASAADADVHKLSDQEFADIVTGLESRRARAVAGEDPLSILDPLSRFDVLVVDYDLTGLDKIIGGPAPTGERVAYLARAFSEVGFVIGLNRYGRGGFDLRMPAHLDSHADLNTGSDHLCRTGLWSRGWTAGDFRPSHWLDLSLTINRRRTLWSELRGNTAVADSPLVELIGISDRVRQVPMNAQEWVGGRSGIEFGTISLAQFARSSGNGFAGKDGIKLDPMNPLVSMYAAVRIEQWIHGHLLQPQATLVDAPHLVERYPSIRRHSSDGDLARELNFATAMDGSEDTLLDARSIVHARFPKRWSPRPCWWWSDLRNDESIKEVREPWNREETAQRFCEDISTFAPVDACRSFVSSMDGEYARRYVSADHASSSGATTHRPVRFTPTSAFLE